MYWKIELIHKDTSYFLTIEGRAREIFMLLKALGQGWVVMNYWESSRNE